MKIWFIKQVKRVSLPAQKDNDNVSSVNPLPLTLTQNNPPNISLIFKIVLVADITHSPPFIN